MQETNMLAKFDKMIIGIVVVFFVMITSLVSVNYFSDYIKTAVKGYVEGALIWSNAQKEAAYHLKSYLYSQKNSDYQKYKQPLEIIEGDRQAALTLISDNPDYEKARQGFIKGNIAPEKIGPMIWLVANFKDYEKLSKSIKIWKEADQKIQELTDLAEMLHDNVSNAPLTSEEQNQFSNRIDEIDKSLKDPVQAYVDVMTEMDRLVGNVAFWINAVFAALLMLCGGAIAVGFIRRAKQWNETLAQSEAKFRHVLDNTRDIIYQMNPDSTEYEYISPSVKNQLGYSQDEILEKGVEYIFTLIHPEDREKMQSINQQKADVIKEDVEEESEFRIKTKGGDYIWMSIKRTVVRDKDGEPTAVVGSIRNITRRKKYEERLNDMLDEKVTLLEEIHHRVKNNLAIISGLLELQKEGLDREVKEVFEESQSRIQSIALVHEKLYKSEMLSEINMKEYISELTEAIGRTHKTDLQGITFENEVEKLYLDLELAIPIGLILNELITNAFRHGFSETDKGILKISLKRVDGNIIFTIADNGKGLPADFEVSNSNSLGMSLINILTKQVEGELEVSSNGWTEFKIILDASSISLKY